MKIDGANIIRLDDGSVCWRNGAPFAADADGSPHAYAPAGSSLVGLDYLGNATKDPRTPVSKQSPIRWVGVVTRDGTETGAPVIQGPGDPAPGYYVSPTSLHNPDLPRTDPLRYVNAEQVPFLAIGSRALPQLGLKLGDLGWVIDTHDGAQVGVIVADVAPSDHLREGSIALLRALGWPGNPKGGPAPPPGRLAIVAWPGSVAVPAYPRDVAGDARARFRAWGGVERARKVFELPELPDGEIVEPEADAARSARVWWWVAGGVAVLVVVWLAVRR